MSTARPRSWPQSCRNGGHRSLACIGVIHVSTRTFGVTVCAGPTWTWGGYASSLYLIYEEESYALQAAVAGQGLVLASSIMVSDLAARGLLALCRPELCVPGAAYTALCVPGRERRPPARAFLD